MTWIRIFLFAIGMTWAGFAYASPVVPPGFSLTTWGSQTFSWDSYLCKDNEFLEVAGTVIITPSSNAKLVRINCPYIHFDDGSSIQSSGNSSGSTVLHVKVTVLLSGQVKLISASVKGSDAELTPGLWIVTKGNSGNSPSKKGKGNNAEHDTRYWRGASAGDDGDAGGKGADGRNGDVLGAPGHAGKNGGDLLLTVKDFDPQATVVLIANGGDGGVGGKGMRGQDGGDGGIGGDGGDGGDGDALNGGESGGNGGHGGDGGNGGNGGQGGPGGPAGNGGSVHFQIVAGGHIPGDIDMTAAGGTGGRGGFGGDPGQFGLGKSGGNPGCGGSGGTFFNIWRSGGGSCGTNGQPGKNGVDGKPGPPGIWGPDGKPGITGQIFTGFIKPEQF